MRYAHCIEMRVFCKEGDEEGQIENRIKELFPFDFKEEKIRLEARTSYGFDNKKIKILSVRIDKERHTTKFLNSLMEKIGGEQKGLLLGQMESRLDDKLHFYIRLDKDKLLNGEYWITDSGNCFRFAIAIAAYPHRREAAEKIVESLLRS